MILRSAARGRRGGWLAGYRSPAIGLQQSGDLPDGSAPHYRDTAFEGFCDGK
jgi:hypothetical protein